MFKVSKKSLIRYAVPLIICGAFALSIWQYTEWRIEKILSGTNRGLEKMAQVQKKNNTVKRNHQGQLLWQSLEAGEFIYVGNSVQTDVQSSSLIFLNSGEKVLIGPQSLVRFIKSDDQLTLQLIDGQLEVKMPEPAELSAGLAAATVSRAPRGRTVIETPRGKVKVKKSSLRLQVDENKPGETKIQVLSGTAEMVDATGTRELSLSDSAEKIIIPEVDSTEKTSQLPLQSLNPQPEAATERSPAENAQEVTPVAAAEAPPPPVELTAPKVKKIKVEVVE